MIPMDQDVPSVSLVVSFLIILVFKVLNDLDEWLYPHKPLDKGNRSEGGTNKTNKTLQFVHQIGTLLFSVGRVLVSLYRVFLAALQVFIGLVKIVSTSLLSVYRFLRIGLQEEFIKH